MRYVRRQSRDPEHSAEELAELVFATFPSLYQMLPDEMLDAAVRNSGLQGMFEEHLSTDRVKAFKPDPRAYRMGVDALGMKKEEIAFAAFAGWDAAGAKFYGYPTFWVNRARAPLEELGVVPDGTGAGLNDLVSFVGL